MKYDFTTVVDRYNHDSSKWEAMKTKLKNPSVHTVPLSVADMEFVHPSKLIEELKNTLTERILGYTTPTDNYYDSVINWMKRRHNWTIERDWIVITPGVKAALSLLVYTFVKPNESVVVFSPVYPPFYSVVEDNGCKVLASPLILEDNHYYIDFNDLEEKLSLPSTKAIIFCSPHNPVGRVWSKDEQAKIMELCLKYDVLMINDEIHHDIIMPGFKHQVMANIDKRYSNHIITCTSVSKTFNLAGLAISNIIIENTKLREQFQLTLKRFGVSNNNYMGVKAVEVVYNQCEDWLEELILVINENYQYLKNFLEKYFPLAVLTPLEGTYLAWINFKDYFKTNEQLIEFMLEEASLVLNDGLTFGKEGEFYQRINLACSKETLINALERLNEAYNSKKNDTV